MNYSRGTNPQVSSINLQVRYLTNDDRPHGLTPGQSL